MSTNSVSVDAYLIFGRLAVRMKYMTPDDLREVVDIQAELAEDDAAPSVKFGELCVQKGYLTTQQRNEIVAAQQAGNVKREGTYFGYIALVNGFITKRQLSTALERQEAAQKTAAGKAPRLGEIFKISQLLADPQIEAILIAQERLRARLVDTEDSRATMQMLAPTDRAAAALAKLADFEAQFGGAVEVVVDGEEEQDPDDDEGGLLPLPPSEITRNFSRDDIDITFGDDPAEAGDAEAGEGESGDDDDEHRDDDELMIGDDAEDPLPALGRGDTKMVVAGAIEGLGAPQITPLSPDPVDAGDAPTAAPTPMPGALGQPPVPVGVSSDPPAGVIGSLDLGAGDDDEDEEDEVEFTPRGLAPGGDADADDAASSTEFAPPGGGGTRFGVGDASGSSVHEAVTRPGSIEFKGRRKAAPTTVYEEKSKTPLYVGLAIAVVAAIGAAFWITITLWG
jgi:hypothetical protein